MKRENTKTHNRISQSTLHRSTYPILFVLVKIFLWKFLDRIKVYKVDFARDKTSDYLSYHDFDGVEDLK